MRQNEALYKASVAEPRCVKCGRRLCLSDITACLIEKCVPACCIDLEEVKREMSESNPMWPNEWFGMTYTISCGEWRVMDEDGGVYDWPITY